MSSSLEEGSVAAVVVTFNRRDKLPTTIASIRASERRPESIVIVDNASTDGTRDDLEQLAGDDDIDVVLLPENVGGAGGFNAGLRRAWELGHDWFWIMDDDCYPEPPALRRLLEEHTGLEAHLGRRLPFSCSLVKYTDGLLCEMNNAVTAWDWPRYLLEGFSSTKVIECSFVSVLVPRWAVTEHGLPLTEYFIWYDDKEFTKRLVAACGPGIQVLDSYVVHDMGVNKGADYAIIDEKNIWKYRYGARNQASFRWHREGKLSYVTYAKMVIQKMRRGAVPRRLQVQIVRSLLTGVRFDPAPERVQQPGQGR